MHCAFTPYPVCFSKRQIFRKEQKHREVERFAHTPLTGGERPRTQTLVCSFLQKFSVTSTYLVRVSSQIYLGPRSDREDKRFHLLLVQGVYLWIMKVTQQFTQAIMTLKWRIIGFSMISHAFCCPVLKFKVEKISYVRWKCAANVKLSQDRLQRSFQKIPY